MSSEHIFYSHHEWDDVNGGDDDSVYYCRVVVVINVCYSFRVYLTIK